MNESIRRSSLLTRRRDTPYLLASCSTVGIGAVSIVRRVCPMASDYRHERASVNVQRYRELMPHQAQLVAAAAAGHRTFLLADEPGLGKTAQAERQEGDHAEAAYSTPKLTDRLAILALEHFLQRPLRSAWGVWPFTAFCRTDAGCSTIWSIM